MKQYVRINLMMCLCLFGIFTASVATADQNDAPGGNLQMCADKDLGVKFLCDPTWKLQPIDNALLIIITSEPDVTMIVARMDSEIKYLSQLTDTVLEKMKHYEEGFRTETVEIGDREAIKVKAFSKIFPNRRLLDYYFIHHGDVHSVLFSVNPKDQADKYLPLFKEIMDSFGFFDTIRE